MKLNPKLSTNRCTLVTQSGYAEVIVNMINRWNIRKGFDDRVTLDEINDDLSDPSIYYWLCGNPDQPIGVMTASIEGECLLGEFPYLQDDADLATVRALLAMAKIEADKLALPLEITVPRGQSLELHSMQLLGLVRGRLVYRMKLADTVLRAIPYPVWPSNSRVKLVANANPDLIVEIWKSCFRDQYREGFLTVEALLEQRKTNQYHSEDQVLLFVNEQPAGMSQTTLSDKIGWIEFIGITPCSRGLGLGKNLTLYCCQSLMRRGAIAIYLGVDSLNLYNPLNIYRKIGFVIEQSWQRFKVT
jgi:GNAT superfamily N-acetyltransferase